MVAAIMIVCGLTVLSACQKDDNQDRVTAISDAVWAYSLPATMWLLGQDEHRVCDVVQIDSVGACGYPDVAAAVGANLVEIL